MTKFKVGDKVIGASDKCKDKLGVIEILDTQIIPYLPYRITWADGSANWYAEYEIKLADKELDRPTLEAMNNRQRRDGGEFKVYAWSEELERFLGVARDSNGTWFFLSLQENGRFNLSGMDCIYDLIEKPVVEEWEETCCVYSSADNGWTSQQCTSFWRTENGVTKLVRVEVIDE